MQFSVSYVNRWFTTLFTRFATGSTLRHSNPFHTLPTYTLNVEVFWVVMPCSVVVGYQHFGGTCCLLPQHYTVSQPGRPRLDSSKTHNFNIILPSSPRSLKWPLHLRKGKGKKVNLSLCLTKHHAMKTCCGSGQLHGPAALSPGNFRLKFCMHF
jgi:hypothetical protein